MIYALAYRTRRFGDNALYNILIDHWGNFAGAYEERFQHACGALSSSAPSLTLTSRVNRERRVNRLCAPPWYRAKHTRPRPSNPLPDTRNHTRSGHLLTLIRIQHVFGMYAGATENETVMKNLSEDLVDRGVKPDRKYLFVINGSKTLSKAIDAIYGLRTNTLRQLPISGKAWRRHSP